MRDVSPALNRGASQGHAGASARLGASGGHRGAQGHPRSALCLSFGRLRKTDLRVVDGTFLQAEDIPPHRGGGLTWKQDPAFMQLKGPSPHRPPEGKTGSMEVALPQRFCMYNGRKGGDMFLSGGNL